MKKKKLIKPRLKKNSIMSQAWYHEKQRFLNCVTSRKPPTQIKGITDPRPTVCVAVNYGSCRGRCSQTGFHSSLYAMNHFWGYECTNAVQNVDQCLIWRRQPDPVAEGVESVRYRRFCTSETVGSAWGLFSLFILAPTHSENMQKAPPPLPSQRCGAHERRASRHLRPSRSSYEAEIK